MDIDLVKVKIEEKPILANLLELYVYDFSEMENNDVGDDGRFGYKHFNDYWQESNRHPFFIKVDGRLAGFVLVNEKDPQAYPGYPLGIGEFFVMRKYRQRGIGERVAHNVFGMFPGKWSVRQ